MRQEVHDREVQNLEVLLWIGDEQLENTIVVSSGTLDSMADCAFTLRSLPEVLPTNLPAAATMATPVR